MDKLSHYLSAFVLHIFKRHLTIARLFSFRDLKKCCTKDRFFHCVEKKVGFEFWAGIRAYQIIVTNRFKYVRHKKVEVDFWLM